MKQGTGLSLSLMWASAVSAQRAADDFCNGRDRAATEAGAALEYAAKAVVVHRIGPHAVFMGGSDLSVAELWVAGDHADRPRDRTPPPDADAARASLLARRSISSEAAVNKALKFVELDADRSAVRSAGKTVVQARNAYVHLGDINVPLAELADAFVTAVEAMWCLIPAAVHQWGPFRDVARVGVLGRRNTWEQDRAIRLAQAQERFHSMGVIYVHRSNQAVGLQNVRCPVCNSAAFFDPASTQPSPDVVPKTADGTVAMLDCCVCGLTLWGPQIRRPGAPPT